MALVESAIKNLERRVIEAEDAIELSASRNEELFNFEVQSTDEVGALKDEEQVMEFADGIEDDVAGMQHIHDPTMDGLSDDYGLSDFLSRPTNIRTYTIPQGEAFNIRSFRPWLDFFTHPAIEKKLDNYAYISCDLKIKFVINSSPFIYGAYGAAYQPLHTWQPTLRPDFGGNFRDMLMLSQRPSIIMESHKNKGGEITCPFFYYKDWLQTSASDLTTMGEITMWPYSAFASANGTATSDVTVKVYAWAENVKLAGPTTLTVQSGDEYGKGPVSSVATAIASMSSAMEKVPIIGKFARATTIGASATSEIAALFGWTNVPVIEDSKPLKNQPFHAFASSEIGTPIEKLTIDPKNELTVDPSVTGCCNEDELSIAYLAQKWSYLTNALWEQSDASYQNLLIMNVTPTWCDVDTTGPADIIYDTPVGHISRMFNDWRGSMHVKLKIVASPYHQGRLRVTYDPQGNIYNETDIENVVVTKIIDLSVTDEAEFEIPYMQPQSWLRVRDTYEQDQRSRSTLLSYDDRYCNGFFKVEVLTTLTGPDTTSSVRVLAFVRGGDDFELANPGELPSNTTPLEIQSSDEILSADGVVKYIMGRPTSRAVDLNLVHFGESIKSIRTVMRRTNFDRTFVRTFASNTSDYTTVAIASNIYPPVPGYSDGGHYLSQGIVNTLSDFTANPGLNTPFTWMEYCYAGVRGSMHYHFNNVSDFVVPSVQAVRHLGNRARWDVAGSDGLAIVRNGRPSGSSNTAGLALQNERTQTGVSFTVPFMSHYKFAATDPTSLGLGDTADDTEDLNYVVRYSGRYPQGETTFIAHSYYSIGTDFNLLFFVGVPKMWDYEVPVPNALDISSL